MRAALLFVAFALLPVACGGRVADPDGGTQGGSPSAETEGGTSPAGTGTATASLPCPILPPAIGDACYVPAETVCAYLVDNLPCTARICDDSGHWQSTRDGC